MLVYQTNDGRVKLDVRLQDETVWRTQQMMADLFQSSKQNISHHINSIYEEGKLLPEATVKKYLTFRQEGKREVCRELLTHAGNVSHEAAPQRAYEEYDKFRLKRIKEPKKDAAE